MLTEKANSPELRDALGCITIVNNPTPEIVIVRPEQSHSSINLLENHLSTEIRFVSDKSTYLSEGVTVTADLANNRFFDLKDTIYQLTSKLGSINIELVPRIDMMTITHNLDRLTELGIEFNIEYNDTVDPYKFVKMRPNSIVIDLVNEREKTVKISVIEE